MKEQLIKFGRLLYGIGIVALGAHQLIIKDFRSEILSPFPAWAHEYTVFSILAGVSLIVTGIIISGIIKIKSVDTRRVCLYLGFGFLAGFLFSHLLFILIFSPKSPDFQVWINAIEELTYSGGAFVMAGSFPANNFSAEKNFFATASEKIIPLGRIFYALLILLFGSSHFIFAGFIASLIPKFFLFPMFWTYFTGVALICSGISIIFKLWIKPIAFLLAVMLVVFFIFFHIPDAVANPVAGGGNEIVRTIIALLFCGIALVISFTNDSKKQLLASEPI
ncbi:DoxX family protein [Flavobacterium mesophilum]|uniref:DoxX family protein n=1 Tax=Flavobacterium mesophilum TaxID=3143495 RepID=UPI0031D882E9